MVHFASVFPLFALRGCCCFGRLLARKTETCTFTLALGKLVLVPSSRSWTEGKRETASRTRLPQIKQLPGRMLRDSEFETRSFPSVSFPFSRSALEFDARRGRYTSRWNFLRSWNLLPSPIISHGSRWEYFYVNSPLPRELYMFSRDRWEYTTP